jgi:hypothetical protein
MMRRKLNIVRATGASPAPNSGPNLSQLLEQAASKARRARDISDGIENIEDATISDLVEISNLCSATLRLINEAKNVVNDNPQPPTPAIALAPQRPNLANAA